MFSVLTGGRLAGIHFNLVLNHKEAIVKGKKQTIYFVTLEFDGGIEKLQGAAGKMIALAPNSGAAKQLMLENDTILNDPEEFAPDVDIDEDGNVIRQGEVVDQIEEPKGKGVFANDDSEREKYYKEVFTPASSGYLDIIDNESPSGKALIADVDPMAHTSKDLSLLDLKRVVDRMQLEAKNVADRKDPKIDDDYIIDNINPYVAAYEAIATKDDPTIDDILNGRVISEMTKDQALDFKYDIDEAHKKVERGLKATEHAKDIF